MNVSLVLSGDAMKMSRRISSHLICLLLGAWLVAGCGGTKLLEEPKPLIIEKPLVSTSDEQCELHLDWVIVRDGPGTWAANADWDEYLLRIRNLTDEPIRITGVSVYDSLITRHDSTANIKKLTSRSRQTARRYKAQGIKVQAGISGEALMAAGTVAHVGGTAAALSAVVSGATGSAAAGAGLAAGALVLGPVLIVSGSVKSKNKDWVARELVSRHTPLPVKVAAGELQSLRFFVPLAPSPRRVELSYSDGDGEHRLAMDIQEKLQGLHIASDYKQR